MEQLNSFDAHMLGIEIKNAPQHISHAYIYDPSTSKQPVVRFKDILKIYEERLPQAPMFRKQLVQVPLNLDNPYWIESPDFNIEYHVRHIALPKPGDWRQLRILLARLHSQALDLSKPMWQVYVIEGLGGVEGMPEGAFAIMTKMHHTMIDGKGALQWLELVHDSEPTHEPLGYENEEKTQDIPGQLSLLKSAGVNALKQPLQTLSKAPEIITAIYNEREFRRANPELELKQDQKTLFNRGVTSPHKVWGAAAFSIKKLLAIKSTVPGATLNDLVVCLTSYAVQMYMEKHGDTISESLICSVAVDVRAVTKYQDGQNSSSFICVNTHSNMIDPLARLRAIKDESKVRKESLKEVGVKTDKMRDVFEAIPSSLLNLSFHLADRFDLYNQSKSGFHYITTNVPGPRDARYMAGAKVITSFGMAPLMGDVGLALVVSSYCDNLSVSFTCSRDTVDDPEFLEQCLYDAFDTLGNAAKNAATSSTKIPATRKKNSKA